MIIATKKGDILAENEKRIAFAVNTNGVNNEGFAGMIAKKYWPELAHIGKTKLGTVLTKKVDNVEFFALTCHTLKVNGWGRNQKRVIRKCFDAIPGDEPVASVSIGTGFAGIISGADFSKIRAGMEASKKKIILY
ncbi:MAG: hypothetical protein HFJ59_00730 [Clostridia bacterium]|nr:hypothetical protein [Clostridia bacterium]